jgi:hypothetical protein
VLGSPAVTPWLAEVTMTLHYAYFSGLEIATTAFLAGYAAFRWRGDGTGGD